jgi:hypothetical protein
MDRLMSGTPTDAATSSASPSAEEGPAPPASPSRWTANVTALMNAVTESFFTTLNKEPAQPPILANEDAELHTDVFDYIEVFYNREQRCSTGEPSPAEYEKINRRIASEEDAATSNPVQESGNSNVHRRRPTFLA